MKLATALSSCAFVLAAIVLSAVGAPLAAAEQQESYTFTLGLLGGVGGAPNRAAARPGTAAMWHPHARQ